MKIVVSTSGTDLSSPVDPRFGRCAYYIVIDTDMMAFKAVPNSAVGSAHGAGIQAAQRVVSMGVSAVLTGNVGPNAFRALNAANVNVFLAKK